eukprot:CAMPEP_0181052096 /NCGR_PEP_ID=MMETSP1070-20121207/17410_1 /TAXON_ID=265543 /ORGANISM="Minutocellus polymorphus, Strain NH13" /LENGTH=61 /DNA_ID=CAMNT_0023131171 /DNA_START=477 /DNA_END=659 /DNA_ORIENTATION=-
MSTTIRPLPQEEGAPHGIQPHDRAAGRHLSGIGRPASPGKGPGRGRGQHGKDVVGGMGPPK